MMKARIVVPTSDCGDQFIREPKMLDECHLFKTLEAKDQRIKELEGTVLDLQSELSRKKMSLTVACNRVEELEDKLKVAVDCLKRILYDEWAVDISDTLEQLGELK